MTKSQIFKAAWVIAKNAAAKFGGFAKQYMSGALKLAYTYQLSITDKLLASIAPNAPCRIDTNLIDAVTTGSQKQNDWATSIKRNNMAYLIGCIIPNAALYSRNNIIDVFGSITPTQLEIDTLINVINHANTINDAKFWIDNRNLSAKMMVRTIYKIIK